MTEHEDAWEPAPSRQGSPGTVTSVLLGMTWDLSLSPEIRRSESDAKTTAHRSKHTEKLHHKIQTDLHAFYYTFYSLWGPSSLTEWGIHPHACRCGGFLFKGTFWLLKNEIISKDKVIRQWQFREYNQSITEYISETDRGVKPIRYKWLYTDL